MRKDFDETTQALVARQEANSKASALQVPIV
jgi:hypothetical protein